MIFLSREHLLSLLSDINDAEKSHLPGDCKHDLVVACQLQRFTHSAPPAWSWAIIKLCDLLIPMLIAYLKKKLGQKWPELLDELTEETKLPWEK